MVVFAAVGPQFKIGEEYDDRGRPTYPSLRALTLALMGSRIILAFQYAQTGYFFHKHYQPSLKPMTILVATYLCAAGAYGALYASFDRRQTNYEDVAWYGVGIFETASMTWVSCTWRKLLSFKGTHLVQRMSLLTLIILGEGAISLAKQCQVIAEASTFQWTATNVGTVTSALLILYFLYMVYFDWIEEESYFGSIREQIWAGLHAFLHLFLVAAVQSASQSILWTAAIEQVKHLDSLSRRWAPSGVSDWAIRLDATQWKQAADAWKNYTLPIIYDQAYNSKSTADTLHTGNDLWLVMQAESYIINGTSDPVDAATAYDLMYYTAYTNIFMLAGFSKTNLGDEVVQSLDPAAFNISDWAMDGTRYKMVQSIDDMFNLMYIVLFVTMGLAVLTCTLLASLSHRKQEWYHWIRLCSGGVVGVTLCLLAVMAVGENKTYENFVSSPWLLPTVCFLLGVGELKPLETGDRRCANEGVVVLVNNVKLTSSRDKHGRHDSGSSIQNKANEHSGVP